MSSLEEHNKRQIALLEKLRDDTAWYIGEKMGSDPMQSVEGRARVEMAMAEIIADGFGAWAAKQAQEQDTFSGSNQ
jgi:hypothetical protein